MTTPKGYAGIRTVTLPITVWRYAMVLAFAGLVTIIAMAALAVFYFGVVLANRPDTPLQAPSVTAPQPKGKTP